jgi:hypothetical protein
LAFDPSKLAHAAAEAVDVRMRRDGKPAHASMLQLLGSRWPRLGCGTTN